MHVRCPNCHTPIEVPDEGTLSDIACASCGSNFSLLAGDETQPFESGTRTLGRFEMIDQIGLGTFGSVWRAHDPELDRTVAVKIPRKSELSLDEAEQFLREARAAAQLRHANIVSVHEVGRAGETVYIVSDLIEGVTLADRLTAQPFSCREAASLCVKVAEALHHAHEAGVIHRDLKPGNILIDEAGGPHVMDFGLARREAGEVTMTVEGRTLGTPAYMSPEQAQGSAHTADRRSDVYSLGVILFEMVTGEKPFRGNIRMLLHQVINEEAPSPRRLNARIPRDLETICLKCLEKQPAKRYMSARDLADDVKRFLSDQPIHARPITRGARSWRWCRRNKMVASLAATTALALSIGMAASVYSARTANTLADQRQRDLYVSDMNVVQQSWAENNRYRAVQLLDKYKPSIDGQTDLREFEWFYYWNLCHRVSSDPIHLANLGTSVAFSPRGRYLAVGQAGGSELVELFDGDTWSAIHRFGPAGCTVSSLAFTPDEKFLAYPAADGTVVLRSLEDKTERLLDQHKGAVRAIAISPDGKYLASGGNDDIVVVRDLVSENQHRLQVGEEGVYALGFSPDGTLLATGGTDGHLRLWDTSDFSQRHDFEPRGVFFRGGNGGAIAFSPDGQSIAWAGEKRTILVARTSGGEPISIDSGHDQEIRAFAFSPTDRILATGSRDSSIKLWNLDTRSVDRVLKGHGAYVQSIAYSPDGSLLASASRDFTARVWDLKNSPKQPESIEVGESVRDVCFLDSPDRALVLLDHDRMKLVNAQTGELSVEVAAPCKDVLRIAVSNDGLIATVGQGGVYLWRLGESEKVARLETNGDIPAKSPFASQFEFSLNGNYLAMGCENGLVRVWDAGRKRLLRTIPAHRAAVGSVALTTQSPVRLATGDVNGQVMLWDVASGRRLKELESHRASVNCLAFSPDGTMLVSGSFDNTIQVWNLADPDANPTVLRGHAGPVHNLVFSKRGRTFISCGGEMKIRVWDVQSLRTKAILVCPWSVFQATLSKDESVLAAISSAGQSIRLWHAPRSRELE